MRTSYLKNRIERVMSGAEDRSRLAGVLAAASAGYGLAMEVRAKMYRAKILKTRKLPRKVVSVGNLTLGGTGKTPMTVYTARLAKSMGLRPVVVCRGYGGTYEKSLGVASNGREILMTPEECGDEPRLIAASLPGVPVVVGGDRCASGKRAIELFDPDLLLLDDAYQHIRLARDVNLLLMDARKPLGNGRIFPRGVLREPTSQLERADALIVTRAGPPEEESDFFKQNSQVSKIPVFRCRHAPGRVGFLNAEGFWENCGRMRLKSSRCIAFSGIANNEDFKRLLKEIGCEPADFLSFADHHRYSEKDIRAISDSAARHDADSLVTTEKDAVKLTKTKFFRLKMYAVGVRISFVVPDEKRFRDFMKRNLNIHLKAVGCI